jgi:AcrR family transcriptional regulator
LNVSQPLELDRRADLLETGARLFFARPYDELSIDDIAREAGVAKGLLYYYFGSKRGYYVAVFEQASRELRERLDPDPSAPPAERLRRSLDAYLGYVEDRSEGYRALLTGGVGHDPQVQAIVRDQRAYTLGLLAEGLTGRRTPRPALRAALEGWLSFVEGASLDWLTHDDVSRDALRELMVHALAGAVAAARAVDPRVSADPATVLG